MSKPTKNTLYIFKLVTGEEIVGTYTEEELNFLIVNPFKIVTTQILSKEGIKERHSIQLYMDRIQGNAFYLRKDHVLTWGELVSPMKSLVKTILKEHAQHMKLEKDMENVLGILEAEKEEKDLYEKLVDAVIENDHLIPVFYQLLQDHEDMLNERQAEDKEADVAPEIAKGKKKATKKAKKKLYPKHKFTVKYDPKETDLKKPEAWSSNPEDYLKGVTG